VLERAAIGEIGRDAGGPEGVTVRELTTCIWADRFCDGHLAEAFGAGLIMQGVGRAQTLLQSMEPTSLQPRVQGLTFKRKDREDAFMDPA